MTYLVSGMIMDILSAVMAWIFFSMASRHEIAQYVSYVSMCRREGVISFPATSCKHSVIGVMASIIYWEFVAI